MIHMVFGILFLICDFITCRYIYMLGMYGGTRSRLPMVVIAGMAALVCLLLMILMAVRQGKQNDGRRTVRIQVICILCIACLMTGFYGFRTVSLLSSDNGKLSGKLQDMKTQKKVMIEKDNLYTDGVQGIFDAIAQKAELPDQLYVVNEFEIGFREDGKITSIYSLLCGRSADGRDRTYLLNYDRSKSEKLRIDIGESGVADYDQGRVLLPFLQVMERASVEQLIEPWRRKGTRRFGIKYYGVRDLVAQSQTEGVLYIDPTGAVMSGSVDTFGSFEGMYGYVTSIFIPGKSEYGSVYESEYHPIRLIPVTGFDEISENSRLAGEILKNREQRTTDSMTGQDKTQDQYSRIGAYEDTNTRDVGYFLTEQLGYRMTMIDAALGTYYYAFEKTTDGKVWKTINDAPFGDMGGTVTSVTFTDENTGESVLTKNGGDDKYVFQTTDGGVTWLLTEEDVQSDNLQMEDPQIGE